MPDPTRLTEFTRDGLTFDVRDEGPPDGAPVVLLHGYPQDAGAFDAVVPRLHAAGLRTLAPDQRGYSPRARPRQRSAYRGDRLAQDIVALLDAAELDKVHVVGHDWGGPVAWTLAGQHRDRLRTVTVLSTPHPAAFISSLVRSGQLRRSWYMLFFQLPVLPERFTADPATVLRRTGLPAEHADRYAARLAEPEARRGALNWYRGMPLPGAAPAGRSKVPTTYVWGSRDFALGRKAAELTADYIAEGVDYEFVELDGGHWLPERHPEAVAEAILARVQHSDGS